MSDYALNDLLARRSSRLGRALASGRVKVRHRHPASYDVHKAVAEGRQPGVLTPRPPGWQAGEFVIVSTATRSDDRRDDLEPTRMVVTHVDQVEVGKLSHDHARHLGVRLPTDVQRIALGDPADGDGRPWTADRVNMAARGSSRVVWITRWVRQDRDAVQLVRAGMQPPSGPLQFRSTDAGEGVDPRYLEDLCAAGEKLIKPETRTARSGKRASDNSRTHPARRAA